MRQAHPRPAPSHQSRRRPLEITDPRIQAKLIAVVWQHISGTPGPTISTKGYLGVDFFFAISGFLITTLLVREQKSYG
jgi:peptidoglycan/LPS O-acetylase OafA/YrhL